MDQPEGVSDAERLSEAECAKLCECVLFHVDAILRKSRIPKVFDGHGDPVGARPSPRDC